MMRRIELIIFSILLAAQFYVYPFGGSEEFAIKLGLRVVMLTLMIFDVLLGGTKLRFSRRVSVVALFAFALLALVSTIYSSDSTVSAIRAIDLVSFIFMGVYFSSKLRRFDDLVCFVGYVTFMYLGGFFLLAYVTGGPILRPMGFEGIERLGGFIVNPNIFAYVLLLLMAVVHYAANRPTWQRLALITVLFAGFSLCYSRSAYLALFVGAVFILKPQSNLGQNFLFFAKFSSIVFFMYFWGDIVAFLERGHGMENLITLGGRTTIWEMMFSQADFWVNLLWGFGYQMLSSTGMTASKDGLFVTMGHNNFVQTMLGLGIFGTSLLIIFWLGAFKNVYARKNYDRRSENFLRLVTFFVFIYSLVEYGIFGPPTIIAPVFLTIFFFAAQSCTLPKARDQLRDALHVPWLAPASKTLR